ncbi:MAG: UvrD-helicase domain-containing protein [Candidatus Brocadiales bacterium]
MNTPLTEEQRKGVEVIGRDVCVTAGAGSGKTHVLVERFINLVVTHKVPLTEILTITFTEKAANEMKERVANRFEALGMEKERQDVEFAYLSTIDSFCTRLLRENAIEAGVNPQFGVLNEYESTYLLRLIIENTLTDWQELKTADFEILMNEISCRDFTNSIIKLISKIRSTGTSAEDVILKDAASEDLNNAHKRLMESLNQIEDLGQGVRASATKRTIDKVFSLLKTLKEAKASELDSYSLQILKDASKFQMPKTKGEAKDLLFLLREKLIPELRELIAERCALRSKTVLKKFLVEVMDKYNREKRKLSLLDFADLEEKAKRLLESAPPIRNEMKEKFEYILVDEFQDTNSLQKSIIDLLRSDNNLFVVGDEKQSIYGFRNADVQVFINHKKETSDRSGELIQLNKTFRSRPEIVDFVNHNFACIWNKDEHFDTEYEDLVAGSTFERKDNPSVELILTTDEDVNKRRESEAMALAQRIHDIVENGELRITNLSSGSQGRNISYGDFALLFRSTIDIKIFERALAELDVPFYVVSGRGFYHTREITDVLNFLKIINNPRDEISLAAVLRSPMVGLNDEALFWLSHCVKIQNTANGKKKQSLITALADVEKIDGLNTEHKNRLLEFVELLEELHMKSSRSSVWSVIDEILEKTAYDTKILIEPNGKQKYANLRKITELTRSFEKRDLFEAEDFFRIVDDLKLMEIRESEAPTDIEEGDVVKLMTIHAAKGLEFPVVIVPDIGRVRTNRVEDFVFSVQDGISFIIKNSLTGVEETPLSYNQITSQMKTKELKESACLFYVAMTRSKEHLILSGSVGKIKGEWLKHIMESLNIDTGLSPDPEGVFFGKNRNKIKFHSDGSIKGHGKSVFQRILYKNRNHILAGQAIKTSIGDKLMRTGTEALSKIHRIVKPTVKNDYIYTVTEILTYNICPRQYYFKYYLGLPEEIPLIPPLVKEDTDVLGGEDEDLLRRDEFGMPGHELGSIVHDVLKDYDFCKGWHGQTSLPSNGVKGLSVPGSIAPNSLTLISNWIESFSASKIGERIRASQKIERELPFVFNYKGSLIRGRIDLVFGNGNNSYTILDYKSNNIGEKEIEAHVKHYELQMQLYANALESIYGHSPKEATLYFLVPGIAANVDVSEEAMSKMQEGLDTFLTTAERGEFPIIKGEMCNWCAYRKFCVEAQNLVPLHAP